MGKYAKKTKYSKEEILVLEFDGGEKLEVGIMGAFEVNGLMYVALEKLKGDDIYLYRYIETEDGFEMKDIPDEDYDEVEKTFDSIISAKTAE